jgi:hypothetical protein
MRQILAQLHVRNADELAVFEREVLRMTLGYSIKRCMAYNDFRMAVQQYHQSGECKLLTCHLAQNHFIKLDTGGCAVLYRHVDEDPGVDDEILVDAEDDVDDKPKKRPKCNNK